MNDYELETLVNRIISGYQYITVKQSVYKLVNPDIHLKVAADILYKQHYQDNLYEDFILKENVLDILVSTETISSTFQDDIKVTEKRLETAKIDLYKNFSVIKNRAKYKNTIASLNKILNEAYAKKHSLDFLTLEHYCENLKNEYIICNTLYDRNDNLVFDDYPNIDYTLFNTITHAIAYQVIPVSTYKKIARNECWKKIYSNSTISEIFKGVASEYTEEQKAILSVSKMYDKIYEHPECPDEAIIEDDDALDGWMLDQQRKNKKQKQEKGVDKLLGKGAGAGEVFMMSGNKKEDIEEIMELNSPAALAKIQARTSLQEGQVVQDNEFSDTRTEIRQQIAELNKRKK